LRRLNPRVAPFRASAEVRSEAEREWAAAQRAARAADAFAPDLVRVSRGNITKHVEAAELEHHLAGGWMLA
jgi:hypothetical protein